MVLGHVSTPSSCDYGHREHISDSDVSSYSSPVEATSAIQDLQNFHLSSGDRLLVKPGFVSQRDGPSTNQLLSAVTTSSQTHWKAGGHAQNNFREALTTQEPIPVHHGFRPDQTNAFGEQLGRGRRYSERRQDADGVAEFVRRPKDTRSLPRTPKKNKKGGKGKSKVSTPTYRGESEPEPAQSQKGDKRGPATYDGRRQSSDAVMVPNDMRSRNMTPARTEQEKPQKDSRQNCQPNKWKRDISEPRPVSLADIIPKLRESPTKPESRAAKTTQVTADGSPSRKSRPVLRRLNTSDMTPEHQTPVSRQEKKGKSGQIMADEWPALRKVENANARQQERKAYSTVIEKNMASEVLDQNFTPELKEKAATASGPKESNEGRQKSSHGQDRSYTTVNFAVAERTDIFTMPILSPMRATETKTEGLEAKKYIANTDIPPGVEKSRPKTPAAAQRLSSPCISPKMADFLKVAEAPWDPCNLRSNLEKEKPHVGPPHKQERRDDNPPGSNSPNAARHASSASGLTTQVTSDTQTDRSASWAELSEKNEPNSFRESRNWRGDLSSATSMADPESRRSSSFIGLSRAVGERKKDPSPSKDIAFAEPRGTSASGSSPAGKPSQGANANRFRPYRRSAQPNSFDRWREDIEARENNAHTDQDSKIESTKLVSPLRDNASGTKDAPTTACLNTTVRTSNKVSTSFESLKGKCKDLTMDIPPRTPSPSITDAVVISRSKSPESGKEQGPVLRGASLSVPVGPIATHKKKKNKPSSPTKLASKKKGTVSKHKENKVQKPEIPSDPKTAEPNDAAPLPEPEIHVQLGESSVKAASAGGHSFEATGLEPRLSTPYASSSYKDIVQDEVALPCSAPKDGDGDTESSAAKISEWEKRISSFIKDKASQNLNSLSAEAQGSTFTNPYPSYHTSPDRKEVDTTTEAHDVSERVLAATETSQVKAQRAKNRNKNRRAKGKGKEKAESRQSSASDEAVPLPRRAEFPTLPLNSPRSSLTESVDEESMFPPLEVVVQNCTELTESWLRQVESGQAVRSEDSPPGDVCEDMRNFDRERVKYQRSKSSYELEKTRKFERLERLANPGGLGIDFGTAPKNGDSSSGKSESVLIDISGKSPFVVQTPPKLEQHAGPESPPLGGPSTPPPLSTEEAATMARLTAKKADCVLELLKKDYVRSAVAPAPGLPANSGEGDSPAEVITPASSECSTEINTALEELSIQSINPSKESFPGPLDAEGVKPSSPVTTIEAGSPIVNPSTPQQLSSTWNTGLPGDNITAISNNTDIVPILPEANKNEAETSSHESPDKHLSAPIEMLPTAADHTKAGVTTPTSTEGMPPPPPPTASATESNFPSLPPAKAPSFETDSSSRPKLSFPHRGPSAHSKLSEANIAALDSTAMPSPQLGRQRGESVKSMSEFSTTSSVRRKLFSDAAASPGVGPRHPEGAVRGGQSLSFVGAPAFLHPPASPASSSPANSTIAHAPDSPTFPSLPPWARLVLPSVAGEEAVASDESSPRMLTAVSTIFPFPAAGSAASATLPLPPSSSFIAGRRRGTKRRRLPDAWTGN